VRQRIEQSGLARIGVAHQRHRQHVLARTRTPLGTALLAQFDESFAQRLDPRADQAAVGFQLFLARAAHADAAALALQVSPAAHQTGRQVLQLGQFDLQLALGTVRTAGEDIQDQADTVDHPAVQAAFQVALLRG